jgi:MoaA/NifB/PqqE/SkfB family radical SAM enzyme
MAGDVVELIWLPTMRCNCRCAHCGVRFDDHDAEEMDGAAVANALRGSRYIASNVAVLISGGEPFLKDGLADFVLPVLNGFENSRFGITTSGTFPNVIADFIQSIPEEYRPRIGFSVSIDGPERVHNRIRNHKNAYSLALASVELLVRSGFYVRINTVIHQENIAGLDELKQQIHTHCGGNVGFSFIPICTDVAKGEDFPYTDEEVKAFFPYLNRYDFYEKYVCSRGMIPGGPCNAGERNAVILPSGGLYTCLVGAAYKPAGEVARYRMGSLLAGGFDDAWIGRQESGALDYAKNCIRCNNPCDIEREHRYFGFPFELTGAEIQRWFAFSGEDIYWNAGWHAFESYEGGSHRWMAAREASAVCRKPNSGWGGVLTLSYANNLPKDYREAPMLLDVLLDGEVCLKQYVVKESEELRFFLDESEFKSDVLEVALRVNQLWKPSDVFGSADERELGVAVRAIRLSEMG